MNELMLYEDICDEASLALGEWSDEAIVQAFCQQWALYIEKTRAENSRPPTIALVPEDIYLPDGYQGVTYVLKEDDKRIHVEGNATSQPATGFLDQPRLFRGRMFQVEDIVSCMANALLKAKTEDAISVLLSENPTIADPREKAIALILKIIPDIIGEIFSYIRQKEKINTPKEKAIVIMAFTQYESGMHDTKNEPFTAQAMVSWLEWAKDDTDGKLSPRVRNSVKEVEEGQWSPREHEVESILAGLADKDIFKLVPHARKADKPSSIPDTLYRINV